ncbi:hypothetical protein M5D96_008164, partial [Drosophila gunungcola]
EFEATCNRHPHTRTNSNFNSTPEFIPVRDRVCCARFNFKRIPVLVVAFAFAFALAALIQKNLERRKQGKSISLLLPKVS